jgi:hypothetical protein
MSAEASAVQGVEIVLSRNEGKNEFERLPDA